MLKDHGVDFGMISRQEMGQLVRKVNESQFNTSLDEQALEFDGFIQFIVHLSLFCHRH